MRRHRWDVFTIKLNRGNCIQLTSGFEEIKSGDRKVNLSVKFMTVTVT